MFGSLNTLKAFKSLTITIVGSSQTLQFENVRGLSYIIGVTRFSYRCFCGHRCKFLQICRPDYSPLFLGKVKVWDVPCVPGWAVLSTFICVLCRSL